MSHSNMLQEIVLCQTIAGKPGLIYHCALHRGMDGSVTYLYQLYNNTTFLCLLHFLVPLYYKKILTVGIEEMRFLFMKTLFSTKCMRNFV